MLDILSIHAFIFMYLIYHFFNEIVFRVLILGFGLSYGVAHIVAYITVGIVIALLFHHGKRHAY